ncbi:MORN repeat-containing protein 4 isoform X1 [Aplysia californica]|uniref:MORN repeat-containing protein 4 isoform X1 n=1 Tax=Aplysia californica TaxID=6500 RepID=A0ABM0JFS8_APLCA|nr:MORN repeat-containing protein 4 isoform X1 [Aplysia californica]XP_005092699.1 MORN repeat-containing protein 4 isoform X1 [Aplysia californica]XP_005092700.1 MORN repeat-containing protein 4 isoform X1 [Aplysia californica]XP_005092701.1 MORN repeat-containing protein 4 isoform X1 [Aplysia californica]
MVVQGEYRYPDGSVYNGQWDDQGQRHGQGLLTLADGGNFRGNFDQGFYSGLGVINFADGSRYCGEFLQGKFNGYGVFVRPDGMKYEGEFKDGKIKGQGLVTFSDGRHGLPRNEGCFDGERILRREKCSKTIQRARDMAKRAIEASKTLGASS